MPTDRARVLLIDDDAFQNKLLARQLSGLGLADVTACEQPAAALTVLDAPGANIELLFLDLNMPDMDGVEFLRQLVARAYCGSVVLVSGEDERVLATAARLAIAQNLDLLGHLQKPPTPERLQALLGQWTARAGAGARRATRKCYDPGEIRRALDAQQFFNHYQPKVELAGGRLTGVETLVRWQHPDDGLVFPDQFIGVAEEHGLIRDLTRSVLRQALAQAQRWRSADLALRVAVNVSMDDLVELDFPEFIAAEITRQGLSAADLILEITESRLMRDPIAPLDIITRLRLKQISLSIDDFGTGHSSLAQLRDIPFDELKIDRGFVHGAAGNGTQRAIFSASLEMGRQLGMRTVAEGVEDRADWDFLRSRGCDLAQGYFFAKPMPGEQVQSWSEAWAQRRREVLPE